MALVRKLDEKEIARTSLHKEVDANYAVFEKDGVKLLQIDSYGSKDREIPGKVSQSLQFDEASAKQLLEILQREFN